MKNSLLFACIISLFSTTNTIFAQGDDCSSALQLTNLVNFCTSTGNYTNASSTASTLSNASCWSASVTNDVWFSFTSIGTDVLFSVNGSGFGPGTLSLPNIALYSGNCSTVNELACCSATANNSSVYKGGLTIGTTYYLRVSTLSGNVGTFDICINNYNPSFNPSADCSGAGYLCDKSPVSVGTLSGSGQVQEGNIAGTCFDISAESNSSWFKWTCQTSGSLTMDIIGANPTDDIDWIIFEMMNGINDCSNLQVARCDVSDCPAPNGTMSTGMNLTDTDLSEPAGCPSSAYNSYTQYLNMIAGHSYVLFINNFSTTSAFTINWGGTGEFKGPKANFVDVDSTFLCNTGSFTFDGSSSIDYSNLSWSFSTGANPTSATGPGPHTVNFSGGGNYTVTLTATDSSSCHTAESKVVTVPNVPGPTSVDLNAVPATCETGGTLSLSNVQGGTAPYLFSMNNAPYSNATIWTNISGGNYQIVVKDSIGCVLDTSIVIPVAPDQDQLVIPNCFTPNQDGVNGQWYVTGECIENFSCTIQNRWGNVVKELKNSSEKWDGTIKGHLVEDGTYFYIIQYNFYNKPKKTESGFIQLIR